MNVKTTGHILVLMGVLAGIGCLIISTPWLWLLLLGMEILVVAIGGILIMIGSAIETGGPEDATEEPSGFDYTED